MAWPSKHGYHSIVMRASGCVGRVGGLAVALGVGAAALTGGLAVASAAPADESTTNADAAADNASAAGRRGAPRMRGNGPRAVETPRQLPPPSARVPTGRASNPPAGTTRSDPISALPVDEASRSQTRHSGSGVTKARASVDEVGGGEVTDGLVSDPGDGSVQVGQDEWRDDASSFAEESTPTAPAAAAVAVVEVPEAPVMVSAPVRPASAAGSVQGAAPRVVVESVLAPLSGADPNAPVEAPLSWVMVAAARREVGVPAAATASPAAAVPTGQSWDPAPAAAVPASAATNSPPVISSVALGAPNSVTGAVTGTVKASDPNGDRLIYKASTASTAKGRVTITTAGVFTYTPTPAARHAAATTGATTAVKTDTVMVTVTDAKGAVSSRGVSVPVSPKNAAPAGARATVSAPVAATGVVTGKVTATDADRDALTFTAPASTAKGSVSINPGTGAFTYTPTAVARHGAARLGAPAAAKSDSFTVAVTDGYGGSVAVPITVSISPKNSAPTATAAVAKPDPVTGVANGQVTAGDTDGDALTFKATKPANGAVVTRADGSFAYTPTPAARASARVSTTAKTETFTITVADGHGGSQALKITATIAPSNSAPAAGTSAVGTPNASTGVVTGSVSATDADKDPVTFSAPASTAKGALTVTAGTGAFTYTPTAAARHAAARIGAPAAAKTDTFTVTAADKYGAVTAIPVSVTVAPANTKPVAGTTAVGTPDASTGGVTGSVSATDADKDTLTFSAPASTAKGTVGVNGGTGAFTYTPTAAARHASARIGASAADKTDSFTVTAADGYGGSVAIPVTVTIVPANTKPVAGTAAVGTPNASTGVVAGTVSATDADRDTLTFSAPASTAKGTVGVNGGTGAFTYTPTAAARHAAARIGAPAADKTDTFTVTATDGYGGSVAIPVTVTVPAANTAPTGTIKLAVPDPATGVVKGAVTGADADKDAVTYTATTAPAKGAVVLGADGGFSYTPTAQARHRAAALTATAADKADTFTVTITDGYGGVTALPVRVGIAPANTAPVASAVVGDPDPGTGLVSATVNGSDADGDRLGYAGSSTTAKGTVVVSVNGAVAYTPTAAARHAAAKLTAAPADKADSFSVTVTDGHGGTVSVPITVAIAPANAAPTGAPEVGVPDASTGVVAGAVLGVDADADVLGYTGSGETARGSVLLTDDGRFTYTPTALARHLAALPDATEADTSDSFVVTVVDGHGGSVEVPVTVAVSPASLNFSFVYGTGSQYWTPEARAALESAATRLESAIVTGRPVTVVIEVVGEDNPESKWLGTSFVKYSSSSPGYYGTVVQTLILTGRDANGAATDSRIGVNFAYPWALGDSVPANQYDLNSVATHELVHTMGVMSGLGDPAAMDRNWTTFDRYLATADGTAVIGADYVWNPAYTPNLTGGNDGLYFAGPNAAAAYGGPVPLYTPGVWRPGSSVFHLDPAEAPPGTTYLMDPTDGYGPGVRRPNPVEMAMLTDLGYTVYNADQSPVYAVLIIGFGLLRRRQPPISERHCSRLDAR